MTATRRLLVDADEFIYKACIANEREINVGDHHVLHTDFAAVRYTLDLLLHDLVEASGATEITLAISDTVNYRKELTDTYKANRAHVRKPMCFKRATIYLKQHYESITLPGVEADDVLGVYSPDFDAIVSSDKDLKTIPGRLYNPGKNVWDTITPEEADWHLAYQAMVGDTADNFKGCPGIGPKRAEKILAGEGHPFDLARAAFEKAGCDEDYTLLQFRLARILRPGEYDMDAKAPILMDFEVAS